MNSIGKPPAARTPSLARLASRSSGRLHGVTSFQDEATPTWGLAKSSSVMPTARSIARAGARSIPSVTSELRGFGCAWCRLAHDAGGYPRQFSARVREDVTRGYGAVRTGAVREDEHRERRRAARLRRRRPRLGPGAAPPGPAALRPVRRAWCSAPVDSGRHDAWHRDARAPPPGEPGMTEGQARAAAPYPADQPVRGLRAARSAWCRWRRVALAGRALAAAGGRVVHVVRTGLDADPAGLTTHTMLRTRRLSWDDIRGLRIHRSRMGPCCGTADDPAAGAAAPAPLAAARGQRRPAARPDRRRTAVLVAVRCSCVSSPSPFARWQSALPLAAPFTQPVHPPGPPGSATPHAASHQGAGEAPPSSPCRQRRTCIGSAVGRRGRGERGHDCAVTFQQSHSADWLAYYVAAGFPRVRPLASWVEGAVYELGDGTVAKVWARRRPAELRLRQAFYADLAAAELPFATPEIMEVQEAPCRRDRRAAAERHRRGAGSARMSA